MPTLNHTYYLLIEHDHGLSVFPYQHPYVFSSEDRQALLRKATASVRQSYPNMTVVGLALEGDPFLRVVRPTEAMVTHEHLELGDTC